jgi:isopenicillin N synthase-like dioxygenase
MENYYYDISNKIDLIQSRMNCFVSMLETLASADPNDLTSGSMWFVHDTVKQYSDQLEELSHVVMEFHAETLNIKESKVNANGKKK